MAALTLAQALQLALSQHQAGRLAEAEALYRQILAVQPEHAEVLNRLGAIALSTGHPGPAAELMAKAVALAPLQAAYHSDLGVAQWLLGRGEEAVACFRRALALRADLPSVHYNLGDALTHLGRLDEAVASFQNALQLQPDYAEALNGLGNILIRHGRIEEAVACYQRATALKPNFLEALSNLGDALSRLERLDEAIQCFRHALALKPDFAEALNNLGNVLRKRRQWAEAMECYRRAVELRPSYAEAHTNLGTAHWELGEVDEAIACCERAVALQPSYAEAQGNLGAAYLRKGLFEQAVHCCRQSVACREDFADGHWNLALLLLLLGHYAEGWREHEWRFRTPVPVSPLRGFSVPAWDGTPMSGQTILLHAEQGYGDTIQFFRYVPLVRERAQAARVILECPPSLVRLLAPEAARLGVELVARKNWSADGLPAFDRHLPLLSLPLALRIFEPLRQDSAYLQADPALRVTWRERLGPAATFRVGVAWTGNPAHKNDRWRSLEFEKLRPLLRVPGVTFYSLQVGSGAPLLDAGLIDLTAHLTDFAETAALMAELDLIISVDTAATHLAGALGRPAWTLLPFVPDWRWGLEREDTPWYPTMRLFRQPTRGDWDSVVQRIANELSRR